MKKWKEITALVLCLGALVWAISDVSATEPTVTQTIKTYSTSKPGDLQVYGTLSFTAVALQADTDSNLVTPKVPLSTDGRLPGALIVEFNWTGAVGGSAVTRFDLICYGHMTSAEGTGPNTVVVNTIQLTNWTLANPTTAATYPITIGTVTDGSVWLFPYISVIPTAINALPQYISFKLDKEGATGKLSAGTLTIRYYAYRK